MRQMWEKELEVFRVLLVEGYSIPRCAEILNYHKTTLYRLLQKHNIAYKERRYQYVWWKWGWRCLRDIWKRKIQFHSRSIHLAREQQKSIASKRYCRIEEWSTLEKYILEKIQEYHSPKQISWRWRNATGERLSKETIYSYVYNNHPELIKKFFRRKGKKCQHKRKLKYQLDNRRMINRRPRSIERRTTLWHWEADTVVWKRKTRTKKCILTNVERKSGFLVARVLENSQAWTTSETVIEAFKNLPKYKRKSMTFDNGREFAYHYDIERELKMTTYFAHPYCSWERGTNENTNWLLRQFLPKWTDFETLTEKELQKYVALINNRPRERLDYMTPNEVFHNKSKSCVWL
jgi:transposase, IS30 family